MEDHMHILIKIHPSISIAKLMQDVKSNSSKFINESNWYPYKFSWQNWYGCFSYAESQIQNVMNYIKNQKVHHKQNNFKDEYLDVLKKFKIDFDERYLFE